MARDAEHVEQSLLFQWADAAKGQHGALALLFAIPNFSGRLGKATARHGARLKAEGRKPGVPDICLPVPSCGHHGLFIELKAGKNRPTAEQAAWLERLAWHGYRAVWCVGWENARDEILAYLGVRS